MLLADGTVEQISAAAREFGVAVVVLAVVLFAIWRIGKWGSSHVDKLVEVHTNHVSVCSEGIKKQTAILKTVAEQTGALVVQHNDPAAPCSSVGSNAGLAKLTEALPLMAPGEQRDEVRRIAEAAKVHFERNV